MNIKNKEILTKTLALGIAGGALSPVAVLANTNTQKIGPEFSTELSQLEKNQGVEKFAKAEDVKNTIKTGKEYKISFKSSDDENLISEGAMFAVIPTYITTSTGELLKLSRDEDAAVAEFIDQNTKFVTHEDATQLVEVDFDGVYRVEQIKRAPGEYLNMALQGDKDGNADRFDLDQNKSGDPAKETLGFEFPIIDGGIIAENQTVKVNPKKTEVDGGTEEKPGFSDPELTKIFGEVLVAKYADHDYEESGNVTNKGLKDEKRISGATFRIDRINKPTETTFNLLKGDHTAKHGQHGNMVEELKERNKATFEAVAEDEKYAATMKVNKDGELEFYKSGKLGDFAGLPEGQYQITEIEAPQEYTIDKTPINVTITVAEDGVTRILYVNGEAFDNERLADKEGFDTVSIDGKNFYKLDVNNFLKPGTPDPKDPIDPTDPTDPNDPRVPFSKTSELDGEITPLADKLGDANNRLVAPGRNFDYNIAFNVPKDINSYKYLELYDRFDEKLIVGDLTKDRVEIEGMTEGTDFKVHARNKVDSGYDSQAIGIVFTKEGLAKMDPNGKVKVKIKDVHIDADLGKEELDELEKDGISNEAKLFFENETGFVVNPKDPDKPIKSPEDPNDPEGDNPNVTPNPVDPNIPGDPIKPEVKPGDPNNPEDPDKPVEDPEIPTTPITKVTPSVQSFEFKKIGTSKESLAGAKFAIVSGTISSELGSSESALDNAFDMEAYETHIKAGEIDKAKAMIKDAEESEMSINDHILKDANLVAVSDDQGKVEFKNLPAGEYVIREIEAPNGYRMTKDPIKVTVAGKITNDKKGSESTISYEYLDKTAADIKDSEASGLEVINYTFNETPNTGTLGKAMYIGAGALVLTIGALGLKKKED